MRLSDFPMLNEIKEEYLNDRREGIPRDSVVVNLMTRYQSELMFGTADDNSLFWIGVADAQFSCKELSREVAVRGLLAIDVIEKTDWDISPKDFKCRRERYSMAPMPERKRFSNSRKFRCTWKLGDTFAYRLSGTEAQECGLEGVYVLIRKVDELEFGDGRLLPVVTFTMWQHDSLPTSAQEFQKEPVLKLANGRLLSSTDLFEYRAELIVTSAKKLAQLDLIYLGNFSPVPMPSNELIIRDPGMITMVALERLSWRCCVIWKKHNHYIQD